MEGKNMQLELIRFLKNRDFIDFTKFEVGLYFRDRCAHCIRGESPLFDSQAPGAPDYILKVHSLWLCDLPVVFCKSIRQIPIAYASAL